MNQDLNPTQVSNTNQNPQNTPNAGVVDNFQTPSPQTPVTEAQRQNQLPPEPEQNSTQPFESDKSRKGRVVKIFILLLLFVAVLSGVSYLAYNFFVKDKYAGQTAVEDADETSPATQQEATTPIDTKEWSTYLNAVHGYIFKHPRDWSTQISSPDNELLEATINSETFEVLNPEGTQAYPIGVATFQVLIQQPFYDDSWESSEESVGGISVNKYFVEVSGDLVSETYLIPLSNANYLEIIFRYTPGDGNKQIFDAMIESFQFLADPEDPGVETFDDNPENSVGEIGDI